MPFYSFSFSKSYFNICQQMKIKIGSLLAANIDNKTVKENLWAAFS